MPEASWRRPTVSVLVPAYNASGTLRETLASVMRQTFGDFEVIVVDDGSSDSTSAVAAEFAASDPRFQIIQQKNGGVAAARNTALAASCAELIAPLDADDLWHPEKLARQVERWRTARLGTVLVYSWSVDIDQASQVLSRRLDLEFFEGDVYGALVLTNFLGNASVPLIARDALLAIQGWDTSLRAQSAQGCEDWQLYLRLAELGDFALAPGFLVGYRQSQGSMSRSIDEMSRSYELIMGEARARHPELPAALFRWSRGAYDLYRFETLCGLGATLRSVASLVTGVTRDLSWLMRRSTRKKVKRVLNALLVSRSNAAPAAALEHFDTASADPSYQVSEGPRSEARRRFVAPIKIRRGRQVHGKRTE